MKLVITISGGMIASVVADRPGVEIITLDEDVQPYPRNSTPTTGAGDSVMSSMPELVIDDGQAYVDAARCFQQEHRDLSVPSGVAEAAIASNSLGAAAAEVLRDGTDSYDSVNVMKLLGNLADECNASPEKLAAVHARLFEEIAKASVEADGPMVPWIVEVCRSGYGVKELTVHAPTRAKAEALALDEAGNHLYNEHASEYSVNSASRA